MKSFSSILILVVLFIACTSEDIPDIIDEPKRDPALEVPFVENTILVFTPQTEAAKLLATSDPYTRALSKFDLISRTGNTSSNKEQDYLDFASQQALEWTEDEKTRLRKQILDVQTKIEDLGLKLNFPKEIELIKSSMQEEGGAVSYTRENYIIVQGNVSENIVVHELFHILSRHNPHKRNDLFKTINFIESNRIEYPEAIRDNIITNPDAPFLEHTINLQIDGDKEEVVFILHSEDDWDGGSFFTYMKQRLMSVEGMANNKSPKLIENMPVLRNFSEATDLKNKIGENTSYTLHPEEILAEHFVMLIRNKEVPDPSFLEAMKEVLQK